MVNDSNVTTFCVQQQIHETGKHPISVSWLSTEKKKGWNMNTNLTFTKPTIQTQLR